MMIDNGYTSIISTLMGGINFDNEQMHNAAFVIPGTFSRWMMFKAAMIEEQVEWLFITTEAFGDNENETFHTRLTDGIYWLTMADEFERINRFYIIENGTKRQLHVPADDTSMAAYAKFAGVFMGGICPDVVIESNFNMLDGMTIGRLGSLIWQSLYDSHDTGTCDGFFIHEEDDVLPATLYLMVEAAHGCRKFKFRVVSEAAATAPIETDADFVIYDYLTWLENELIQTDGLARMQGLRPGGH